MKLYTLERGGKLEEGINIQHGFLTLGNSTGFETLIQILGSDFLSVELIKGAVILGPSILRIAPEAAPIAGIKSGAVGLLIRNQSRDGQLWEMRGPLLDRCPFFGERKSFWKKTTECPNCDYPIVSPEFTAFSVSGRRVGFRESHKGYIFEKNSAMKPVAAGYIGDSGPEYFLIVQPGDVFSIYTFFGDEKNDLIVSYESDRLTVWTPERYLEWKREGMPATVYTVENIDYEKREVTFNAD